MRAAYARAIALVDRRDPGAGRDRLAVTGAELVAEVYPAAARLRWNLSSTRSVTELQTALALLHFADQSGAVAYVRDGHAFDALVARAVALDLTEPPRPSELSVAAVEGWIHLPRPDSLAALASLDDRPPFTDHAVRPMTLAR
jgi:hypothetical protein